MKLSLDDPKGTPLLHGNFTIDEIYMQHCIELAKKGSGYVSPNPMVGCVIVKNEKIISEGYHRKYGEAHAEVNAINQALKKGFELRGTSLYSNLEPCSHFGKTPPCIDKIIENKIRKVIIGIKDPNPLVAGNGIKQLKKNGIEVITNILKDKCTELNKFFLKNITKNLPYVTLKAAQSIDGKIAETSNMKWISSIESRKFVHELRSQYDAVLAGRRTVEFDNPRLTVRLVKGRNPWRVIIDKDLKLDLDRKIYNDNVILKTIILTLVASTTSNKEKIKYFKDRNIKILCVKEKKDFNTHSILSLKDALKKLYKIGISSILVEGGAFTFSQFIRQGLTDEIILFIAPKIFGRGLNIFNFKNAGLKFKKISWSDSGDDKVVNIRL